MVDHGDRHPVKLDTPFITQTPIGNDPLSHVTDFYQWRFRTAV